MNVCNCSIPNCGCAGGMHTYAPYYQALLDIVKPAVVMEWGPGPNTQMALDAGASVTAVEHDRAWIPEGSHERFACIYLPVNHKQYTRSYPIARVPVADIYFIDGRRRDECLDQIPRIAGPIACLHDAQRKRYQEALNRFSFVVHLIYGFAIASHDERVNDIADKIHKEVKNG